MAAAHGAIMLILLIIQSAAEVVVDVLTISCRCGSCSGLVITVEGAIVDVYVRAEKQL